MVLNYGFICIPFLSIFVDNIFSFLLGIWISSYEVPIKYNCLLNILNLFFKNNVSVKTNLVLFLVSSCPVLQSRKVLIHSVGITKTSMYFEPWNPKIFFIHQDFIRSTPHILSMSDIPA